MVHETFTGKTILISGGAGYLAASVVSLLKNVDCQVVRLDREGTVRTAVTGTARIIDACGDVGDPEVWERQVPGADIICHFAAQTSTYDANDDPVADHRLNVMPMLHLLETCRRFGTVRTVCFSSTVTIAGIPQRLPVNETHPDHPLTMYDLHKKMAEEYLRWYSEQGVVQGVALRLANVYGPGPGSSRPDRGVLNQMIRRAVAGEPLTAYGTGSEVRDYLYVEDAARSFLAAAAHAENLSGRSFVIGSGTGHTIAQALQLVADRCAAKKGVPVEIRRIAPPAALSPIESRNFIADPALFCRATGWRAECSLAEGIDRTLEALS